MPDGDAPQDVNQLLDRTPESDVPLGAAARKTSANASSFLSLVDEARSHLRGEEIHGRIRAFSLPPGYEDIFKIPVDMDENQRNWAIEEVQYFRQVVDQYKDGQYDPVQIEQDIVRLSANLVFFSSFVNYIDSISLHAERTRKDAEAVAFIELRKWTEENGMGARQFGVETMRAIATAETQDQANFFTTAQSVASTIKGFYYALKDFIGYLDRVSQRAQAERMASRRV